MSEFRVKGDFNGLRLLIIFWLKSISKIGALPGGNIQRNQTLAFCPFFVWHFIPFAFISVKKAIKYLLRTLVLVNHSGPYKIENAFTTRYAPVENLRKS